MNAIKVRDPYFDNVKFILILLVVIGHFLEPCIQQNILLRSIYLFIYTFHMPAFVLISGYFSKIDKSPFKLRLITKFLIPYIIFQLLFMIFAYYFLPNQYDNSFINIFRPYYIYWYLLALFAWNLALPYFVKLKRRYAILVSILIGIFAGYFSFIDSMLSISRILVFFPFFLIGYYLDKEMVIRLRELIKNKFAVIILLFIFLVYLCIGSSIDYRWLWGYFPYEHLQSSEWYAGIYRLGLYIIALIGIVTFCTLIPSNKTFYTNLGTRTLTVYLLHGFIVKLFYKFVPDYYFNSILLIFIAVVTTFLLSWCQAPH